MLPPALPDVRHPGHTVPAGPHHLAADWHSIACRRDHRLGRCIPVRSCGPEHGIALSLRLTREVEACSIEHDVTSRPPTLAAIPASSDDRRGYRITGPSTVVLAAAEVPDDEELLGCSVMVGVTSFPQADTRRRASRATPRAQNDRSSRRGAASDAGGCQAKYIGLSSILTVKLRGSGG